MKIEIWSDIACPFCYIGLRKLQKALAEFPYRDEVELVWHSYELNPGLPTVYNGLTYLQFFTNKMHVNVERAHQVFDDVTALALRSGLKYNFAKAIPANTFNAMRLIKLVATINQVTEMEEVLFAAHFTQGLDVSDPTVLIQLGTQIGLKEGAVEAMLASDQYKMDVKKDYQFSKETLGIQSVPFYLFNNKFALKGAVDSKEYLHTLNTAYNDWKQNGVGNAIKTTATDQSCSIDGVCE